MPTRPRVQFATVAEPLDRRSLGERQEAVTARLRAGLRPRDRIPDERAAHTIASRFNISRLFILARIPFPRGRRIDERAL